MKKNGHEVLVSILCRLLLWESATPAGFLNFGTGKISFESWSYTGMLELIPLDQWGMQASSTLKHSDDGDTLNLPLSL